MYRNRAREEAAEKAAGAVDWKMTQSKADTAGDAPLTGIILGTGWGDTLSFEEGAVRVPLRELPGFEGLETLEGHARELVIGALNIPGSPRVVCLRGRVHMNEAPSDPNIAKMARLQVEMMEKLGARRLVLTCAAGGTDPSYRAGDVAIIRDFVAFGQDEMPLWVGEFLNPSQALDARLRFIASDEASAYESATLGRVHHVANYCFWRGPHFESKKDKENMADLGASIVGMSVKPECCIAAVCGLPTLAIAYVTNGREAIPEHGKHLESARENAVALGDYLARIVQAIDRDTP